MKLHLFFADEELFTVAVLRTSQNDLMYAPVAAKQPDNHASQLSVAVSKLDYTNLIFIERGTKINRQYYQELLLTQELLSVICSIAECVFSFSKRMH